MGHVFCLMSNVLTLILPDSVCKNCIDSSGKTFFILYLENSISSKESFKNIYLCTQVARRTNSKKVLEFYHALTIT